MRAIGWLAVAAALFAASCAWEFSAGTGGTSSSARTSPPAGGLAISQAADLRTHLDLLLAEHVMLVAKETSEAANHSDQYASYAALLTSNQSDLVTVMRGAFGNSYADDFGRLWALQNGYLVDYGIGAVTRNDGKSSAAISGLNADFIPKFANLVSGISGLATDTVAEILTVQGRQDKAFIDDLAAQKYASVYSDLQTAFAHSSRLGDALAERIAQKFPDKFPGDPTVPRVDRRVSLDLILQQHAWLATMATEAVVGSRDQDKNAATAALSTNAAAISRALSDLFGPSTAAAFDKVWTDRDSGLVTYAGKGDAGSKRALLATGPQFSAVAHIQAGPVNNEINALIKVIDDQRSSLSRTVAGDDRAAATSMQPVGDAIVSAA